jgi:hypothetical protein
MHVFNLRPLGQFSQVLDLSVPDPELEDSIRSVDLDPDPDPRGQKWPTKKEKGKKF